MWITGLVDVPETVLLAQQQRRLVVFAGAGVSAAEPSSLPLFVRLAERIAAGACVPVTDDVKTNPDVFLGRLEGNGVPVHGRVKALVAESARPNRVHDVRHTAATALKDLCVPARDAQLILGHSHVSITQQIYQYHSMDSRCDTPEYGSAYFSPADRGDSPMGDPDGSRCRQISRQTPQAATFHRG